MNDMEINHAERTLPFFLRSSLILGQSSLSVGAEAQKNMVTLYQGMNLVFVQSYSFSSIIHKSIFS